MTEEEAKTKECCGPLRLHLSALTIVGLLTGKTPDDFGLGEGAGKCIGSACMAWRWPDGLFVAPNDEERKTWRGFCGLAGKP